MSLGFANSVQLIFIHGPAAAGKLTVARALSHLTGLRLFHNHLVVDALLAVFDFASPAFVKLREAMWLDVFGEAASMNLSLIFTFMPEATVSREFVPNAIATVERHRGRISFVELRLSIAEQECRINAPSRHEFRKLTSLEILRKNREAGADDYPALPDSGLVIDTGSVPPEAAAQRIATHFGIPALRR